MGAPRLPWATEAERREPDSACHRRCRVKNEQKMRLIFRRAKGPWRFPAIVRHLNMNTQPFRLLSAYDRQLQLHNSPRRLSAGPGCFPPGDIPEKVPDKNVIDHPSPARASGAGPLRLVGSLHHRVSGSEGSGRP